MGIFSDIRAMRSVAKIKAGGVAKLSISQITRSITNMPDAQRNLSPKEFDNVYALYKILQKCNTKLTLDMHGFIETAVDIIKRFDKIAPYEKYSGGNETEYAFMMDDIRSNRRETSHATEQTQENACLNSDEDREYIDYIVSQSLGRININDTQSLIKVLNCFKNNGKSAALREFDLLATKIINEKSLSGSKMFKISFLSSLLHNNGMLSENESSDLSKKYTDSVKENIRNSRES